MDSEYARVTALIKILHNRYLTGSEYASSSEYASVTQDSVENFPSYMLDRVLNIPLVLNMLGLEYIRVVNM